MTERVPVPTVRQSGEFIGELTTTGTRRLLSQDRRQRGRRDQWWRFFRRARSRPR